MRSDLPELCQLALPVSENTGGLRTAGFLVMLHHEVLELGLILRRFDSGSPHQLIVVAA